jgi:hypothetical protein
MKKDIKELTLRTVDKGEVFEDAWELYEHLDYDGSLHEIIDSNIDLYYYDLRKWSVDNYNYIEDAIEEGLCEGVSDFHKLIQCGQYLQLREEAQTAVEELFEELDGLAFNWEDPSEYVPTEELINDL